MYRPRPSGDFLESSFFKLPGTLLLAFDEDCTLRIISDAWAAALGFSLKDLQRKNFLDMLHENDRTECADKLAKLRLEGDSLRFSGRCQRHDGSYLGVAWSVTYHSGEQLFYASAHETAVNLSGEDASLPDMYVDGLTGLPNRHLFLDRLEHTWQRGERRRDLQFAVVYCGIDRFKVVNHSLGQHMGDLLLISVANLLRNTIRPTDMVARLAGDEFGVILEDIRDVNATLYVISRIQEKLILPFELLEHEVFTTVSFGIAVSGPEYKQHDEMIRDANMAMGRAKKQGGGGYVVFNKEMHDRAVLRLELELDLRQAIEHGEFQAYYQPIVALADRSLSGFEALVRWRHPRRGLISPDEFIPLAEETGLIVPLGRWMLREACRQARDWQLRLARDKPLTISVNLSARQILHPDLLADVRDALAETGLPPTLLKLEITESAVMENTERAIELLKSLRAMQIHLLLDDFGTGYSSLSYLHRLPIDTLKIDRSFISDMHENETDRHFVETIVHLAHKLGRDVICEGVELEQQAQILAAMGVEYSQGFLYSRPVAANEAEMLILTGL